MVAVDIPRNGRLLMEAFWPGPLTLLLPKSPQRAGNRDRGASPGRGKDAASPGGPETDRARGSAGRGAQREFFRQDEPHSRGVCPARTSMGASMP